MLQQAIQAAQQLIPCAEQTLDDVSYIVRGINLSQLDQIIKDEYKLIPNPGVMKNSMEFNKGIFTQIMFNENRISQAQCVYQLYLCLDKRILEDKIEYHISTNTCAGIKYYPLTSKKSDIKSYTNYTDFLKKNQCTIGGEFATCCSTKDIFPANECVFQDNICLRKWLRNIYIPKFSHIQMRECKFDPQRRKVSAYLQTRTEINVAEIQQACVQFLLGMIGNVTITNLPSASSASSSHGKASGGEHTMSRCWISQPNFHHGENTQNLTAHSQSIQRRKNVNRKKSRKRKKSCNVCQ